MYKLFLIISVWPALAVVAQQQTVVCSFKQVPQTCPADTSNGVLLVHEESEHLCRQGKTWRYDSKGIHVYGGCSASFLVNPRKSNAFGESGYHTYGTGENAFHTNGHVGPSGGSSQRGVEDDFVPTPPQNAAKPK